MDSEFGVIWAGVLRRLQIMTGNDKWNDLEYNSFQESHNSRRKREIAEKQIDDSKKFSLFAERKYQTLVSISQEL